MNKKHTTGDDLLDRYAPDMNFAIAVIAAAQLLLALILTFMYFSKGGSAVRVSQFLHVVQSIFFLIAGAMLWRRNKTSRVLLVICVALGLAALPFALAVVTLTKTALIGVVLGYSLYLVKKGYLK